MTLKEIFTKMKSANELNKVMHSNNRGEELIVVLDINNDRFWASTYKELEKKVKIEYFNDFADKVLSRDFVFGTQAFEDDDIFIHGLHLFLGAKCDYE